MSAAGGGRRAAKESSASDVRVSRVVVRQWTRAGNVLHFKPTSLQRIAQYSVVSDKRVEKQESLAIILCQGFVRSSL